MSTHRLSYLFGRYILQQISAEEEDELMGLLADIDNKEEIEELLDEVIRETGPGTSLPEDRANFIFEQILQQGKEKKWEILVKTSASSFWRRMAVAAGILFAIAGTAFWFLKSSPHSENLTAVLHVEKPAMIVPGGDKAVLTREDGTVVILDSLQNGVKLQEGSTEIEKNGATLIYNASELRMPNKSAFNTLSTPRGGQFKLVLPDGSRVWLNSSSSLRYPVVFSGSLREVELSGEAYFEIAKDINRTFRVNVSGLKVEVLGTHFNVNAYDDEETVKTSLLEGKVRVRLKERTDLLEPGQQEIIQVNSGSFKKIKADMEAVVAWKNGLFQFDNVDIKTIMRQVSRWYDADIEYQFPEKDREQRFEGKISRTAQLSDILKILELSGVKFKIEGKKIVVL